MCYDKPLTVHSLQSFFKSEKKINIFTMFSKEDFFPMLCVVVAFHLVINK